MLWKGGGTFTKYHRLWEDITLLLLAFSASYIVETGFKSGFPLIIFTISVGRRRTKNLSKRGDKINKVRKHCSDYTYSRAHLVFITKRAPLLLLMGYGLLFTPCFFTPITMIRTYMLTSTSGHGTSHRIAQLL